MTIDNTRTLNERRAQDACGAAAAADGHTVNGKPAIPLRMRRARIDGKTLDRGSRGAISEWWSDHARRWHRTQGSGAADKQLGAELATAAKRPAPFSHVTVGRFFRKDDKRIATTEIADALLALYPDLPPYTVTPLDLPEALELAAVHKRALARAAMLEDERRAATEELLAKMGFPPTPDRSESHRQRDQRTSEDETGARSNKRRGAGAARRATETSDHGSRR